MNPTHEQLLSFTNVAGNHIFSHFNHDCCIAAAAIMHEALNILGVYSRPLTCGFTVYNPPMMNKMEQFNRVPDATEAHRWHSLYGAWAVGCDPNSNLVKKGRWNGHLILIVEEKWMIDLTIIQADRPDKDIILVPQVGPVINSFLQGDANMIGNNNGCLCVYSAYPDNKSYESRPDWSVDFKEIRRQLAIKIAGECASLNIFPGKNKENSHA